MTARVLVTGGRDYADHNCVAHTLNALHHAEGIAVIIHGAAHGADRLCQRWAAATGVEQKAYPAAWEAFGRSAGPKRNQKMLDEGKPDVVVAFPGGRGTADMVARAKKAGVRVVEAQPTDCPEDAGQAATCDPAFYPEIVE